MTNAENIDKYSDKELYSIFKGLCYLTSDEECHKAESCEHCRYKNIIKWLKEDYNKWKGDY